MNPASTSTPQAAQNLFIAPQDWFAALDWPDWFTLPQPIEVDLGAGDGGFVAARAQANPGINFVAVERLLGRARKIDRKGRRLGLANLRVLRIESLYAVRRLFAPGSVRAFYLLFPDPWPKKRHHKNRIIRGEFLGAIERALVAGGQFFAATDHTEYFAEMIEAFRGRPGWTSELVEDRDWFAEKTDFETHFLREGKSIGRMKAVWGGGV